MTTIETGARVSRPIGRLVLYATPVALSATTGYLISQALTVDPSGCSDPKQRYLPDFGLLLSAGGAVLVGRFLGYLRYQSGWAGWQQKKLTQIAGTTGLCLLLLGAAVALSYEAIGVDQATSYGVASAEPITYYIRCAIYDDKMGHGGYAVFTLLVLLLSGGVVGHWLWAWHPPEHYLDKPDVTTAER